MGVYHMNRGTLILGRSPLRASFSTLKPDVKKCDGDRTQKLPSPREKSSLKHLTAATLKHGFYQQQVSGHAPVFRLTQA